MALVWKLRRDLLTRAASSYAPAAALLVGGIAWSGHLAGLLAAPLLVYLWSTARSRSRAFILALCYYLAAGYGLVAGAGVFFAESTSIPAPIPGLLLWLGYSALLATAWGGVWGATYKPIRLIAALTIVSVPPIGIVGGFNPLLAAGVYFPGLGWLGLSLMLAWSCLLVQTYRHLVSTLPFAAAAVAANICYIPPSLPNWSSLDTSLGPATTSDAQYDRMMILQRRVATWSASHAPGSVLVLPELVGDDWSVNGDWWKHVDAKLKARQQIVFIGAYLPQGIGSTYENVIVSLGRDGGSTWRDRVPVPVSMWKPWTDEGAIAFWSDNGVREIGGKRVASLVCYEQLLIWPAILSLLEKPDVLIAPANDWWATETNLPELQRVSVQAWARTFSIPSVWSTNR
jgi:hypothetical protein